MAQVETKHERIKVLDSLEAHYTKQGNYYALAKVKQDKSDFIIKTNKLGVNAASLRLMLESAKLYARSGDSASYFNIKNGINYYVSLSEKENPKLFEDLKRSVYYFEKVENEHQLIWAHQLIISYLLGQRDYRNVFLYKNKLQKLAGQLTNSASDKETKAGIENMIATVFLELFQHECANNSYLDSAEVYVRNSKMYLINQPTVSWLVYMNEYYVGLIEEFRKNYDKALGHYQACKLYFVKKNDKLRLNAHIEECYYQKGDFKKAHQYAVENRQLVEELRKGYFDYLDEYGQTWKMLQETELENLLIKEQEKNRKTRANQLIQWIFLGILALVTLAVVVLQKQYNTYQRKSMALQMELNQQRRDSTDKILAIQEQDRQHLARELHDSLGGMLSISKLTAENIQIKFQDQKLESLIELLQRTQSELYEIINYFQPNTKSLTESLNEWLLQMQHFHSSLNIHFEPNGQEQGGPVVHQQLFRIVQELVHNTIKHAQASNLLIELSFIEKSIILLIRDDGIGFDITKIKQGWGLHNLQLRLNMLGGDLEFHPAQPCGIEVLIHVHLENL